MDEQRDEMIRAKRARARRDNWVLVAVCVGAAIIITWVLWINGAFLPPTR